MALRGVILYACLVLSATTLLRFNGKMEDALIRQAANPHIAEHYGQLPLSFDANEGQTDSSVRFLSSGSGYSLFLTANEAVLSLQSRPSTALRAVSLSNGDRQGTGNAEAPVAQSLSPDLLSAPSGIPVDGKSTVLRMKLVGSNPRPEVAGLKELPGKSNYFIGNDPARWRTNVSTYAKVHYENVYDGIDLVYYGNQGQLEYDFVVSPGADPRAIRFSIDGDERIRIDGQGDLVLEREGSEIRLQQPVIYQEIAGTRQSVNGNFVIQENRQVGFEVARYDAAKPLIIDPVLSYSTYLGGSGFDQGNGITIDSSGNAYVTGTTASKNFPAKNAIQAANGGGENDVFVTKLNAAGSAVVYSTYFGGSGSEIGRSIAVDSNGNAYVTGITDSKTFPTANAFQAAPAGGKDAFVAKLNSSGSALVFSTFLGGSNNDDGGGIALDPSGNIYTAGTTNSADFPRANAFQSAIGGSADVFVTKLNPAGAALIYSTYLGGNGTDEGNGIAVDSSGNAYVAGTTTSDTFPTSNAIQAGNNSRNKSDLFVTKLNPSGSALVYSTYYGGARGEYGSGIAVDASGNVFVTGYTDAETKDLPRVHAFQAEGGGNYDAFVVKINAAGSALVFSTYLGGSGDEYGAGVAVDPSGNAYVIGSTTSTNFPTVNAFRATSGGKSDTFVTKFNAAGAVLASNYLGGSGDDYGAGIVVDSSGNAYVMGYTASPNFPTANAFQTAYGGGSNDVFVTKFPVLTGDSMPPPQ